jgi:hypothetical protein
MSTTLPFPGNSHWRLHGRANVIAALSDELAYKPTARSAYAASQAGDKYPAHANKHPLSLRIGFILYCFEHEIGKCDMFE